MPEFDIPATITPPEVIRYWIREMTYDRRTIKTYESPVYHAAEKYLITINDGSHDLDRFEIALDTDNDIHSLSIYIGEMELIAWSADSLIRLAVIIDKATKRAS